jgi:photosystem II stability/assembly factor-like uncharacterized protein
MKRISLLILSLLFVAFVNAQQWTKNLPKEKASSSFTFFDYQNAFYSYWEPYNVKGGFYIDDNGERKKAPGWKQFKRWEYYWEARIDLQTGELYSNDINVIFEQEKYEAAFKKGGGELWVSTGPNSSLGGYAGIGRINTIAYHPTNADMFWVGTASGGLWVTSDGGQSWTVLNDNMQALGVSDIIIPSDYETSKIIYLATGDRDAFDTRSIGLLRSTNSGASWWSVGLDFDPSQGVIIYRALIDPVDNETLIVSGNFGTRKGSGLTGGWSEISSERFIDMEYKPGDFNTLYGATKSGGIFVSINGGNDWNQVLSEVSGNRVELAVSPDEPTWIYAIMVNDYSGLYGIYKSEDSGQSFNQLYDGMVTGNNLLDWYDGNDEGGQGWYDLAIAVSPTDANTILVGGINTWISNDAGVSWNLANHWYGGFGAPAVHADKHYLGYQTSTGVLFEGNDGGIYKTSDYELWIDLSNGIVNSQIYRLGTSATEPGETIAGLQDNGTKLLFAGNMWEDVKGGDGMECIIDYTNVNVQYGSYVNGQISKTIDRWDSSFDISDNIPGGPDGAWVTPYIINPKDPNILYVGYSEIWKTKDGGETFSQISDFNGLFLRSLVISPSDTNTIYASSSSAIRYTNDGGENWNDVTGTLPTIETNISSMTVKYDDANTIWVTMSGYNNYSVFESTDAGLKWKNISEGLPDIPCNTIVQNKLNTSQVELYAGTDLGVYLKLGDNPWIFFSTGLPNVVVSELEIYYDPTTPSESKLKAATYGRGLWETIVYDSGVQTGARSLSKVVDAIYPNPSNGHFNLDFTDYNGEEIDVEIKSLSGKLVYKNSFNVQSNTINLEHLADGVYVLQVKKNNQWYGQSIIIQK